MDIGRLDVERAKEKPFKVGAHFFGLDELGFLFGSIGGAIPFTSVAETLF